MSQENVEVVRRVYEAAARRDPELSSRCMTRKSSWIRLGSKRWVSFDRVYYGHDGLRSFFREWHEAWEGIEYDYDELIDAGERVISVVTPDTGVDEQAGPRSIGPWHSCGRSARARSSGWCGSRPEPMPSNPPGCGSSCFGRKAVIRFAWKAALSIRRSLLAQGRQPEGGPLPLLLLVHCGNGCGDCRHARFDRKSSSRMGSVRRL